MGFFDLFRSKPTPVDGVNGHQAAPLGATHEAGLPEIPEKVFVATEPPTAKSGETAAPQKQENNIDLLYKFLDHNHEEAGYNDALRNPDTSHMNQNIEALRNELSRTLRKVNTFYEDFMREIDFHIKSRSRSGMVDTVEELEMKKAIAESHIAKVKQIETDAEERRGPSEGIVISYKRGFENGLAAITHHNILSRKF